LLKVYEISPEKTKEILNQIDIQLTTTSEFLDNILFWTKSQMKGLQLNFEILNLSDILADVINLVQNTLIQKNILFTNHTAQNIKIFADSQTLHVILRNLIMNAIKFTNVGGHIEIITEIKKEEVNIGIKDSGIGISEETQKTLFQIGKYFAKGTSNETGHGLGLWICKDFIEKNNGKIWLESQINQGSTFWFSLPTKNNS
jgi:signal transduction histidine kinase